MKYLVLPVLLLLTVPLKADWKTEKAKIEYLLQEISMVEGVFVRNETEHAPQEAVEHLRMKIKRAMESWFAPKKEKWTAEMFIDKLASKSSLSGKPYQIKLNDGRVINSRDWLNRKLKQFKPTN